MLVNACSNCADFKFGNIMVLVTTFSNCADVRFGKMRVLVIDYRVILVNLACFLDVKLC